MNSLDPPSASGRSGAIISSLRNSGNDARLVSLFFLGLVLAGFLTILWINDGTFVYTLDDPYIHLAVAEELAAHGHYGVNSGELSAPCSSPLWPFLMVPFAGLPHFELVPFVVSAIAGFATALVALGRVRRMLPTPTQGWAGDLLRVGVTLFFVLGTNMIGLVFTGMEHSVQVLLAVLVVEGMLRLAEGEKPARWFDLAVVMGPWIRYENMALTLAAVAMLFILGRRQQAFLLGLIAASGVLAFSGYLVSLGLSPVPASITAKSTFTGADPVMAALRNLKGSLASGRGMLVALGASLLIGAAMLRHVARPWKIAALCVALAGVLHLVAGAYGWVNRYEIYILAALIWCFGGVLGMMMKRTGIAPEPASGWALLPLLPTLGFPYFMGLATLPLASNNIYEQQYQMHRFAVDFWGKPVAVNDLGYVSYRNPNYVLDLWGLASPQALKARMGNEAPEWMSELAEQHKVELAMVYEPWFPNPPKPWRKIATLRLSRKLITPAWHEVTFYATGSESSDEIIHALKRFKSTLPAGVALDLVGD